MKKALLADAKSGGKAASGGKTGRSTPDKAVGGKPPNRANTVKARRSGFGPAKSGGSRKPRPSHESVGKIYGVHAVEALLRHHPKRVKQIWLAEGRSDPRVQTLIELANENRVQVGQAERREMDAWVEGVHQGVVAEVSPSQVWGEAMLDELLDRTEGAPLLLVLDGVTDPHNLGACLRSADAAGALAVIVPKDKSATLTPVVRKACGAAEVIPLVAVTNLARTLEKLQQRGLWVVGTAGEAEVSCMTRT
jgi:23S rRNA (guanosine2251-2'-O)-methyltransferase